MSDPGSADLSADVDFSFLKQAILKGSGMFPYQADKRPLFNIKLNYRKKF